MSRFSLDHINVASVRAYYDQSTSTKVKETNNLLQYESQHFRCKVRLEFSECFSDHNWSIGLIQACDNMYLENKYGSIGSSFWEFHPLRSKRHKMVNDSDGRQYPFYSLTSSKCEVRRGMVQESVINLQYEDHFYPTVAWELPYCGGARLTDVIRKQDFWVWLVAIQRISSSSASSNSLPQKNNKKLISSTTSTSSTSTTTTTTSSTTTTTSNALPLDCSTTNFDFFNVQEDKLFVLKTIRWKYNLHMTFDPYQTVGNRLISLDDIQDELPFILESERTVPISAVTPPHCNAAQSLLWYPRSNHDRPKILVPPRQTIVPWETWLTDMVPSRMLVVQKPKDCKLVGEWNVDENIGITTNIPLKSSFTNWKKQISFSRYNTAANHRLRRHSADIQQRLKQYVL